MFTHIGKAAALVLSFAFALSMSIVAPFQAVAVSPYDRPNAIHCVAWGVYINAPTNVPVIGDVRWQAEVQGYNTATNQWEPKAYTDPVTNVADGVYVTAGPWFHADGNTEYSPLVTITSGTGRIEIRVYNHFWRAVQGEWEYLNNGWFSTLDGTAAGPQTCILDNGPIVV